MSCFTSCLPKATLVKYEEIKNSLKTGDIVLFSGSGTESWWVQFGTFSSWSHIGMVVRCPHVQSQNKTTKNELYLWHSYSSALHMQDEITGTVKSGVQLNPLFRTLKCYSGKVFIRKLNLNNDKNQQCSEVFHHFLNSTATKPYTSDLNELLLAAYDGPFGENVDDFDSYFCSKLIAHTWMKLGIIGNEMPASEYTPRNFSTQDPEFLYIKNGYLEDEIQVIMS